jgi:hypothetical protein
MILHGQDAHGRDVTSETRANGVIRYSVARDGVGILYIDQPAQVPFERVLNTINAHSPPQE